MGKRQIEDELVIVEERSESPLRAKIAKEVAGTGDSSSKLKREEVVCCKKLSSMNKLIAAPH